MKGAFENRCPVYLRKIETETNLINGSDYFEVGNILFIGKLILVTANHVFSGNHFAYLRPFLLANESHPFNRSLFNGRILFYWKPCFFVNTFF